MGWRPLLSVLSPRRPSRSQGSPGGQLGGRVGKGRPVATPPAPSRLAAAVRLPEEGQVMLAQDPARPRRLGLRHDILEPGRHVHLQRLVALDEAVFLWGPRQGT